ncbi:hypothetical protein HII36_34185 [Nonomuraea sp. NN258]|uniref:DUF7144 family membrane protein n=1 Tax=Nonomuraea antri TaxID=2730852 RepID=UPI00156A353A|nr:hypothetical protein [Nonomuraea antri]NRQ36852.1 hypothetical protein [Nonomuraea antri]
MTEQVSTNAEEPVDEPVSGWTVGIALFAGITMVMIGMFQAFQGLIGILRAPFYLITPGYAYDIDVTIWGWAHLVLGTLVAVAGCFVFTGVLWARIVGIVFAVLNAVAQFMFLPYYPVWALLLIVMDVFVIWALCAYNREAAEDLAFRY